MVDILDVCCDKALQGIPKVSKSVDELAEDYSSKYPTAEKAAKALVANQLVKVYDIRFSYGTWRDNYTFRLRFRLMAASSMCSSV